MKHGSDLIDWNIIRHHEIKAWVWKVSQQFQKTSNIIKRSTSSTENKIHTFCESRGQEYKTNTTRDPGHSVSLDWYLTTLHELHAAGIGSPNKQNNIHALCNLSCVKYLNLVSFRFSFICLNDSSKDFQPPIRIKPINGHSHIYESVLTFKTFPIKCLGSSAYDDLERSKNKAKNNNIKRV